MEMQLDVEDESIERGRRRACRGLLALATLFAAATAPLAAAASGAAADADAAWRALERPGGIVLLRHADAPGVGDPPGFTLADCRGQRNLGDAGRQQARRLGDAFRSRPGVRVGAVLASQWCRTRETAQLAFGADAVREEPAFNSFFGEGEAARREQTARADAVLRAWRGPGVLVVVTHQVNITALTGEFTASAEGVVLRPAAGGRWQVVGRLPPP
jgi:phosphohistidine phosphatase SixA